MGAQSRAQYVHIVDAGNFSLAARNMKTSRANVSYRLTQLEKSVGLQLMRGTRDALNSPRLVNVFTTTDASFATKFWQQGNQWPRSVRGCMAPSS